MKGKKIEGQDLNEDSRYDAIFYLDAMHISFYLKEISGLKTRMVCLTSISIKKFC